MVPLFIQHDTILRRASTTITRRAIVTTQYNASKATVNNPYLQRIKVPVIFIHQLAGADALQSMEHITGNFWII